MRLVRWVGGLSLCVNECRSLDGKSFSGGGLGSLEGRLGSNEGGSLGAKLA